MPTFPSNKIRLALICVDALHVSSAEVQQADVIALLLLYAQAAQAVKKSYKFLRCLSFILYARKVW